MTFDRGDLLILDFDPQIGHEQKKRRPALVLSTRSFNDTLGLAFVAPVTSKPKRHAFEVQLPEDCVARGAVLVHQTKSLDLLARRAKKIGSAPMKVTKAALEVLKAIIDG